MSAVVLFRGFQYHYLTDGTHGPGWYIYINGHVRVKVVDASTLQALQASQLPAGAG
jgi:hypothetical protein